MHAVALGFPMLRLAVLTSSVVLVSACSEAARPTLDPVTSGPVMLAPRPPPAVPPVEAPTPVLLTPAPELLYAEPLPLPARHALRVAARPVDAQTLRDIEALDVELVVEGGPRRRRELSVVFVSPLGLAWEQQARLHDAVAGAGTLRFSLPVAGTLVEEQGLAGRWQVTSLDDGVELATTSVEVAP